MPIDATAGSIATFYSLQLFLAKAVIRRRPSWLSLALCAPCATQTVAINTPSIMGITSRVSTIRIHRNGNFRFERLVYFFINLSVNNWIYLCFLCKSQHLPKYVCQSLAVPGRKCPDFLSNLRTVDIMSNTVVSKSVIFVLLSKNQELPWTKLDPVTQLTTY